MTFTPPLVLSLLFAAGTMLAQTPPHPKITGISHIAVYTSDPVKSADYYQQVVGCTEHVDFEGDPGFYFNPYQFVEVLPLPSSAGIDRLDHIAFQTANAETLRRYLAAHEVSVPAHVTTGGDGTKYFSVKDYESNKVEFVEPGGFMAAQLGGPNKKVIGHHIIHVGMLIRDRAAADRFYRDLLGFRLYWHGGMQPDKTDWVAMQVPDGTDWLEYMLTSGPSGSGIPANMSQRSLGVLNHLSVGVVSMAAAVETLKSQNRLNGEHSGPQIGKDGKWQFNLFDPDETRLELMEFTPVQKPCCAPFTGPQPSPSM